jgi:hypothetical protein
MMRYQAIALFLLMGTFSQAAADDRLGAFGTGIVSVPFYFWIPGWGASPSNPILFYQGGGPVYSFAGQGGRQDIELSDAFVGSTSLSISPFGPGNHGQSGEAGTVMRTSEIPVSASARGETMIQQGSRTTVWAKFLGWFRGDGSQRSPSLTAKRAPRVVDTVRFSDEVIRRIAEAIREGARHSSNSDLVAIRVKIAGAEYVAVAAVWDLKSGRLAGDVRLLDRDPFGSDRIEDGGREIPLDSNFAIRIGSGRVQIIPASRKLK